MFGSRAIVRKVTAVSCCLVAVVGQMVFAGFVLLLGLDLLPERTTLAAPWPWLVNGGWLVGFALQHSGMARQGFKCWWTRIVPASLERSCYVAWSGLLLIGLSFTWQLLPGEPLWQLPTGVVVLALLAAFGTGLVSCFVSQASSFGLRQAWAGTQDSESAPLQIRGPYRYLRHPLMTCLLVFFWAQPVMRPTLFVLSAGMTLYILVAIRLEERELRRQFGQAYVDYRQRVPALIPWRPPLAPGSNR